MRTKQAYEVEGIQSDEATFTVEVLECLSEDEAKGQAQHYNPMRATFDTNVFDKSHGRRAGARSARFPILVGSLINCLSLIIVVWLGWHVITPACAQDDNLKISGPALPAIVQYLSRKAECPDNPEKTGCTLGSNTIEIGVFYGQFPGDPTQFAVAFVATDTGGSGAALTAAIFKADRVGIFSLIGDVGVFGGDPRQVRFGAGHTISYIGTVMKPGDAHCCPTGSRHFRLKVGDAGISFSE